jgi:hypothetical protein
VNAPLLIVPWVVRFLKFQRKDGWWRHPHEFAPNEISDFLSHLATDISVAAATQNQALREYSPLAPALCLGIMAIAGCM